MRINLKFFASVRETLGTGGEAIDVPAGIATVGALRALLVARGGLWAEALGEGRALRMACNQRMCHADEALADNAEVAFFPPVTGG
ncbi:molybdopterin converting factor subunit 1 [Pseudoduganella umbonata]|uniref:Molybdopterin converting factor subunit 1 n=1 Tax=Pseudoduganella umbonata TaxID=864828 RepID=A0A4P8HKJ2_9BURK|nr:molybdopterin converting factor subunit 1 [Pseudoduganella umbonata]MBB3220126.1 molybdopterin synthase sulfur carrier subunit [Pseudoduganella umbonata]QCP10117.1 molybdopterin converting factor subunit 1 [Pseudoduganella umbonata]